MTRCDEFHGSILGSGVSGAAVMGTAHLRLLELDRAHAVRPF